MITGAEIHFADSEGRFVQVHPDCEAANYNDNNVLIHKTKQDNQEEIKSQLSWY